jgi:glycosyltransferase involved in cell wall biosynthesis
MLPSAIDLSRWPPRPDRPAAPVVIGWAGTPAMLAQLEVVKQPLARVCRAHPGVVLRIVCDEALVMEGVSIEHRKFAPAREVADLESFDIAIAPQVEDPWTRGKVPQKVLAYFAASAPTVASDVASHRFYIRDGENGFLAGTLAAWEEHLNRLIADAELRRRIGQAGRATAERDFAVSTVVPKYVRLFESLKAK